MEIKSNQTLKDCPVGSTVQVEMIKGEGSLRRRIMDMGITRGVMIQIQKEAPLGDPIEVQVRGYELTLRKTEAEQILVKKI